MRQSIETGLGWSRVGYRRLSLYLDTLQVYPIKRLASMEGWEVADLLRVVTVVGLLESFKETERLTRRLKYGALTRDILRPFKALRASSLVMDLRLPEGLAMIIDVYARKTTASRNLALSRLILAGTKTYCEAKLSFLRALKASRTEQEPRDDQHDLAQQRIASKMKLSRSRIAGQPSRALSTRSRHK
jgi:hypothetical protein